LSVLLFAALPCSAQKMETAEYRDFLKRLDAAVTEWQTHVESLKIEDLNVTFSIGKTIEQEKQLCLENIAVARNLIRSQRNNELLSDDVSLNESLSDLSSMLGEILGNIPENAQAVHWARALPSLDKEIHSYQRPLRKHISAYANQLELRVAQLELKVAKCSR